MAVAWLIAAVLMAITIVGIPEAWRVAGLTDEDYLRMTAVLGATRTLEKPFRPRQLLALVREVLANRAS